MSLNISNEEAQELAKMVHQAHLESKEYANKLVDEIKQASKERVKKELERN